MKSTLLALAVLTPICAIAQEPALRISAKNTDFRIEIGTTLFEIPNVFKLGWLDINIWAGAGATVTEGKLSGSFSALIPVPDFSKRVRLALGIEYKAQQDQRPGFDLVAHFTLNRTETLVANTRTLMYIKKF